MSKIVVAELEGPSTTSNKITIASGSQLDLVGSAGTTTIDASDITTGSLSSTLTFPGRLGDLENLPGTGGFPPTANVWRENAGDDSAVAQIGSGSPYTYWRKLDNEVDPYGLITLASDAVTITYTGTYSITFQAGVHFRTNYNGTQLYDYSNTAVLAASPGGFNSTDDKSAFTPVGFYEGSIAAGTVLRIYGLATVNNTFYWRSTTSDIFATMTIQLIGT